MDAGLVKLLEVVLLFGAVVAFGVWQLRSVDRDRRARLAREAAEQARARAGEAAAPDARQDVRGQAGGRPGGDSD